MLLSGANCFFDDACCDGASKLKISWKATFLFLDLALRLSSYVDVELADAELSSQKISELRGQFL